MTEVVSVIMPAYNCADYIAQSVTSALEQDYPHKEIIVVDDGSTDNTLEVLAQFGDRIRVIRQSNAGPAVARNTAMHAATGTYLAFLDSDDLWLPGKLTAQVNYLRAHPDVGMVYSQWAEWSSDKNGRFGPPPQFPPPPNNVAIEPENSGWIYNALLTDCIVHTTTALLRSDVARQAGAFDPELRRGQDYDYWLRVSRIARIDKLACVLSLYRIHNLSVTHRPLPVNYGYLIIRRAVDRWGGVGPDGRQTPQADINAKFASLWYGFGYNHSINGDRNIARAAFRSALRYRPFWLSAWVNYLRTLV